MSYNQDVLLQRRGRCGVVTLNRPKALNALSYDMIAQMERNYIEWAGDADVYGIVLKSNDPRAFCSGGDIKALYDWKQAGKLDLILELYTSEYQHNWTLDRFIKPHVALINGIVFGGGVGLSLFGTHMVAAENYRLAMPEVGIGFFPDVGATHFLPKLPGQIGLYLALTGEAIDRADAYAFGLLTHCIDSNEFDAIEAAMVEAEPIDPVLDGRHIDPGPSGLLAMRDTIDRYFSGDSVEAILDALGNPDSGDADWAKETAAKIQRGAPFSLKVAYHQVRNAEKMSLEEALALDGRIARVFLQRDDFYEGVRALLIDKAGSPRWSPAELSEVSNEAVARCFAPEQPGDFRPINPFL